MKFNDGTEDVLAIIWVSEVKELDIPVTYNIGKVIR